MTETATTSADIRAAHALVKDLFKPVPARYWAELVVSGTAGWAAVLAAAAGPGPLPVTAGLVAVAAVFWYRAVALVHDLTHHTRGQLPGFHLAWNLAVGVAWLLPSVMYEKVHLAHHRKTTYGTAADPEYLLLSGRPAAVAAYLLQSLVIFPGCLARFLVGSPAAWVAPPVRRFVCRSASSYVINLGYERAMTAADRRWLVRWELVVLAAWGPPVALTLAGDLPWRWLACWYALYTTVLFVNRLRMLSAHRFASGGHRTDHLGQFRDSVDTPGGWWTELAAPLGTRYHALHHLFPSLPYHNLGAAYRRLSRGLPADSFYHAATAPGLVGAVAGVVRGGRPRAGRSRPPDTTTGGRRGNRV